MNVHSLKIEFLLVLYLYDLLHLINFEKSFQFSTNSICRPTQKIQLFHIDLDTKSLTIKLQ